MPRCAPPSIASRRTSVTYDGLSAKNPNPARSTCSTFSQPIVGRLDRSGEPSEPVRQQALEHLAVQHFLGREVVEQRLPADADLGDDVVQRRAVVPVVREAGERGVEDLISGGAALADGDVVDRRSSGITVMLDER